MRLINETKDPAIPNKALRSALAWLCHRAGLKLADLGTVRVVNGMRGTAHLSGAGGKVTLPYCTAVTATLIARGKVKGVDFIRHDATFSRIIDGHGVEWRTNQFVERAAWIVGGVVLKKSGRKWHSNDWRNKQRHLIRRKGEIYTPWSADMQLKWLKMPVRKPKPEKPKPDPLVEEVKRLKVSLVSWHRKEKLATTKIKTISRKILRLERRIAKHALPSGAVRMFDEE